jgi:hypothetical protein
LKNRGLRAMEHPRAPGGEATHSNERNEMRAGLRFGVAALAIALAFAPLPALAQDSTAPATNTTASPPASDAIGPRELENFSLNGVVTRPAETPPARATPAPRSTATPTPAPPSAAAAERNRPASRPDSRPSAPAPSVTTTLAPAEPFAAVPGDAGEAAPTLEPAPALPPPVPEEQHRTILPWLLALLLLGAGAGYFVLRGRSQPSYAAAGRNAARFAAPQPQPRPAAAPAPQPKPVQWTHGTPPAAPQDSSGIVSTRLRPWLEIEFSPGRCVVEDDKATIQFDVAVFNSGSAPARDVLVEASMFNAGPAQDQEIGAFFERPVAKGRRIPEIPPLKRIALKSAVSLTREQVRQFEVAGKRIFVPLIGFNALYRWSGGDGQTSASYLVGRDTKAEKMAPLRLDLGPRIFRGLGARQHSVGVRR